MLIFGRRPLIRVLDIYIEHYNRYRPTEVETLVRRWINPTPEIDRAKIHRLAGGIGSQVCSMSTSWRTLQRDDRDF